MPSSTATAEISWLSRWASRPFVALLVFLVVGLAVYSPALQGEPIWDDGYLIGENPFFKSPIFVFEVFQRYLFLDSYSVYYRPVQNLSYLFDYWLWGGNVFGYHLTNVLLHSGSGFLLFLLLRRLLPRVGGAGLEDGAVLAGALAVALVWTVHPIHNAAVAYTSGRADSLASLFALGAWLLTLRLLETRSLPRRVALGVGAAGLAMLALCSKEIALLWLVLFLLHLLIFEKETTWPSKLVVLGSVALLFGCYLFLRSLPDPRTPPAVVAEPLAARVLLMLRALGDYTGLIFFPARLTMDRTLTSPAMYESAAAWRRLIRLEYLSVLGTAALMGGAWLCSRRGAGARWRIFGACWFVIAFLPISNLFPLNAEVAEHWIYLASIGYLIFVAGCVPLLPRIPQPLAIAVVAGAMVALSVRTAVRAGDWRDAETFYRRTIESGGGTVRIHTNLASIYADRGEFAKQEALLRRSLRIFPAYMPARLSLGICLVKQGRAEEAKPFLEFDQAATASGSKTFRHAWAAALHRAQLAYEGGHAEAAIAELREAQQDFPEIWELGKYEAELLRAQGDVAAALRPVEQFATAHWWHHDAWLTLGQLRVENGNPDGAVAAWRHSSKLDIHDAISFERIAQLEFQRGQLEAAVAAQRAAIRRDPDRPSRYLALASVLEKLGRGEEAAAAEERARDMIAEAQQSR